MRTSIVLCIVVMAAGRSLAGEPLVRTGNIGADLSAAMPAPDTAHGGLAAPRKSLALAAVASAVIPGAGQAYVGNWWRGAAFFCADVIGVAATLIYNHRGDGQTANFQNFADQNIAGSGGYTARWDVVKYAEWVNAYVLANNIDSAQITIKSDGSLKPWDRVDWAAMNVLEKKIGDANPSTGFSHTLPTHGQQQYYEEIGKYPQYGHGWDDASVDLTNTEVITPHLQYYSGERGKANRLYSAGTAAVVLVMVNHLASAIEAAVSARSFNKSVEIGIRPETYADGTIGMRPQIDFHVSW